MKRVSFEVSKALKEAGYPQEGPLYYTSDKELFNWNEIEEWDNKYYSKISAPYAVEVWFWLWREKGLRFELAHPEYKGEYDFNKLYCNNTNGRGITDDYSDPEEAIISAINYIVDNNLIK